MTIKRFHIKFNGIDPIDEVELYLWSENIDTAIKLVREKFPVKEVTYVRDTTS